MDVGKGLVIEEKLARELQVRKGKSTLQYSTYTIVLRANKAQVEKFLASLTEQMPISDVGLVTAIYRGDVTKQADVLQTFLDDLEGETK